MSTVWARESSSQTTALGVTALIFHELPEGSLTCSQRAAAGGVLGRPLPSHSTRGTSGPSPFQHESPRSRCPSGAPNHSRPRKQKRCHSVQTRWALGCVQLGKPGGDSSTEGTQATPSNTPPLYRLGFTWWTAPAPGPPPQRQSLGLSSDLPIRPTFVTCLTMPLQLLLSFFLLSFFFLIFLSFKEISKSRPHTHTETVRSFPPNWSLDFIRSIYPPVQTMPYVRLKLRIGEYKYLSVFPSLGTEEMGTRSAA